MKEIAIIAALGLVVLISLVNIGTTEVQVNTGSCIVKCSDVPKPKECVL